MEEEEEERRGQARAAAPHDPNVVSRRHLLFGGFLLCGEAIVSVRASLASSQLSSFGSPAVRLSPTPTARWLRRSGACTGW